jgi:hypothetical protein
MYRLGNPFARIPNPGGQKTHRGIKGEPELSMMREKTDGLCNSAHCNMPFWMVSITLNPDGLRVNCFFSKFALNKNDRGGMESEGLTLFESI